MYVYGKPKMAFEIKIGVAQDKEQAVSDILWKPERIWHDQFGEAEDTELRIYLKHNGRAFKHSLFRAGPKNLEGEKSGINKHLSNGVIKPAISEWASQVLFVRKRDGRYRFCIYYI